MNDFIAIDFETANECHSSVCSVGTVLVRDGRVVDSYYSLIHPVPEYYRWFCQQVHGLSEADTDDANHQLHTVSAACGYNLENHHHALADAEACAAIAIL